ncbi:MAG TPA: hypothetical protein VFE23_10760 [Usitatibacter sp.]|nr:hypothetical protein [Usitatibacter sp.]
MTPAQVKEVAAAERSAEVPAPVATPPRVRSAPRIRAGGDCESGHWVESVSDDGSIVKLEDGSIWEVDAGDNIDSALWLPTTDIVACADKLINTEDNEKVGATRIK